MNNYAEINTAYLKGGEVCEAKVCAQVSNGIGIHIIGLPVNAVKESLLRVVTALQSAGYHIPGKKIVICVEPVIDIKSNTSGFDLPLALAILSASGQIDIDFDGLNFHGELRLDGTIRATGDERAIVEYLSHKGISFWGSMGCVACGHKGRLFELASIDSLQQLVSYADREHERI